MRSTNRASMIAASLGLGLCAATASAQTLSPRTASAQASADRAARAEHLARVPAKRTSPRDKYGSPLDTLCNTHIYTTVPEAEGFVKATRPAAKDLRYTPLTGIDPKRPKPRDKANVAALQAELEQAAATTQAKAGVGGVKKARRGKAEN